MERAERFGLETPPPPDVPVEDYHLVEAFWALRRLCGVTEAGPLPLQPGVLRDWQDVTGERLSREDSMALLDMDAAWRAAVHAEIAREV